MRFLLCFFVLGVFLAGCGGNGDSSSPDEPSGQAASAQLTATPRTSATPPSSATPRPSPTPNVSPTPEPTIAGPASVGSSIQSVCRAGNLGTDLVVRYAVRAAGTSIQRVKLLINGEVAEDSGPIARNTYEREYVKEVNEGVQYRMELEIDAPGARAPVVLSLTRCASVAPPGPRA